MAFLRAKRVKISAQIAAEKDSYLQECFLDNGYIETLIENRFELIAGRKGSGKTAIAKYLQANYRDYGLDFAARLTLSDFYGADWDYTTLTADSLLKLLIVRTAQKLFDKKMLSEDGAAFWGDYLQKHGLQNVTNFNDWFAKRKVVHESKNAGIKIPIASADLKHSDEVIYEAQLFDESASTLASRLLESIKDNSSIIIIIDDLTDHLDDTEVSSISKGLEQIRRIINSLSGYNSKFSEDNVNLTFVCTIRDDLWDMMNGSNDNKLKHNSLWLEWSEEDFCKLLIKRLPHFSDNTEEYLLRPYESIKQVFPDQVFEDVIEDKKIKRPEVKRFQTKFYAYMQIISFNRPRDFLRLCFALSPRLSETKPVETKHIIATEYEYETYFYDELKDELGIFAKSNGMNFEKLHSLFKELSNKSSVSYPEFRQLLVRSIGKSSHSETYKRAMLMWKYSLIGYKLPTDKFAKFKHMSQRESPYIFLTELELRSATLTLHRGIYFKLKSNVSNEDRIKLDD